MGGPAHAPHPPTRLGAADAPEAALGADAPRGDREPDARAEPLPPALPRHAYLRLAPRGVRVSRGGQERSARGARPVAARFATRRDQALLTIPRIIAPRSPLSPSLAARAPPRPRRTRSTSSSSRSSSRPRRPRSSPSRSRRPCSTPRTSRRERGCTPLRPKTCHRSCARGARSHFARPPPARRSTTRRPPPHRRPSPGCSLRNRPPPLRWPSRARRAAPSQPTTARAPSSLLPRAATDCGGGGASGSRHQRDRQAGDPRRRRPIALP